MPAKPAHARAAAVSKPLPPGCASALAALPAQVPATEQQAEDAYAAMGGRTGNATADSLADDVAADAFDIGFDFAERGDMASAVRKYTADVATLRSCCG